MADKHTKSNDKKNRHALDMSIATGARNALRRIPANSSLANINLTRTSQLRNVIQQSFTADKREFDQEITLSEEELFGFKNRDGQSNLFGLTPAVRAQRYEMLSQEPELDDILERLIDELIVYTADSATFCEPQTNLIENLKSVNDEMKANIADDFVSAFDLVYYLYAFNGLNSEPDRKDIKRLIRKYLVEGRLAFEIVYDNIDEPTEIINVRELNAFALVPYRKADVVYWRYASGAELTSMQSIYSSKNLMSSVMSASPNDTILLDSQVVYLSWSDDVGAMSYFERLVRAFNLLRIIERSRIAYATTASRFRTLITIPTKGKSKQQAALTLRKAINMYHERIDFDDQTGELKVNGEASMPFNSEFWAADGPAGAPSIQNIGTNIPDMGDTAAITYFRNNLQRLSKMPLSRFDEGGGVWNVSAESMERDERRFATFIDGILQRFGVAIILKPVYIQMCLRNDMYIGDKEVLNALRLVYNKYNHFQTQLELDLLLKRVNVINEIQSTLVRNLEIADTEQPFWSSKFLIERYLDFPKTALKRNAELLATEIAEAKKLAIERSAAEAVQASQTAQLEQLHDVEIEHADDTDANDKHVTTTDDNEATLI